MIAEVRIVDVFVDGSGGFGGGVGVVFDEGHTLSETERRSITRQLGYEEAVFVNDVEQHNVSVYTPQCEIPFAGQPMVGVAWLLYQLNGEPVNAIRCLGGEVGSWQSDGLTWIRADLGIMPPWNIRELPSVAAVERLTSSDADSLPHTLVWAWADEARGHVRARTFAADWEIGPEVETNGSGSMMLANLVRRSIKIKHGRGSIIHADAEDAGFAVVGGRVVARTPQLVQAQRPPT